MAAGTSPVSAPDEGMARARLLEVDVRVVVFRGDDAGYLSWLTAHPDGFVLNIARALSVSDARLHHASCRTLPRAGARALTQAYVKVCSTSRADLDTWVTRNARGPVRTCGTCAASAPPGHSSTPPPRRSARLLPASTGGRPDRADTSARFEWSPPAGPGDPADPGAPGHPGDPVDGVRLWSQRYLPFERHSPAELSARGDLRRRLGQLTALPGQVLEATYCGPRPAAMDVENLLLYNIDSGGRSMAAAAARGVRFEHLADRAPVSPTGWASPCFYEYRLAPADGPWRAWTAQRDLARFTDVSLGRFPAHKRLEQVWYAIRTSTTLQTSPNAGDPHAFAVRLWVRPPAGTRTQARPALVKGLLDGVIAGLQTHLPRDQDSSTLQLVAERVAGTLAADAGEVASLLTRTSGSPLGSPGRLVFLRGPGVQWNPSDHLCIAAQVLLHEPADTRWLLSGHLATVAPGRV